VKNSLFDAKISYSPFSQIFNCLGAIHVFQQIGDQYQPIRTFATKNAQITAVYYMPNRDWYLQFNLIY
jgi:hypothetical protein